MAKVDPLLVDSRAAKDKTDSAIARIQSMQLPSIGRKRITCHSMRHSRATRLLEAGVNLIYIRDILGHASVTTTEIYAKTNPELKRKYLTEHSATYSTGEKYTPEERNDLVKWLKDNF